MAPFAVHADGEDGGREAEVLDEALRGRVQDGHLARRQRRLLACEHIDRFQHLLHTSGHDYTSACTMDSMNTRCQLGAQTRSNTGVIIIAAGQTTASVRVVLSLSSTHKLCCVLCIA